jgi:hypothetical protein
MPSPAGRDATSATMASLVDKRMTETAYGWSPRTRSPNRNAVPEPAARANGRISASAASSSPQFRIVPTKMSRSWLRSRAVIGLARFTMIVTPSSATANSPISNPFEPANSRSRCDNGRDAMPMSAIPCRSAAIPSPEPPPFTMTSALWFLVMKSSAQAVTDGRIDSEPTACTEPDGDAEFSALPLK